ncbi:alpha/beta fold hydrolase [Planktotalea sp.]|uniref:bifunctional alpha/beta hydrolase/OsmC family protein n=1 Tax=Planktotalea sp. TaxID=2029877 RepID=UPI0025E504E6|nr:alpha/beta fold hydrolase [Planktotalea sp.]
MPTERLAFPGHSGHDLAARLDLPDGPHLATALFAHCFTCSKDIPAARRIAQRLADQGIAVLRFDFTGLGHSLGEFANTTFTSNVDDLKAAADMLASRGMAPSLLIGHSLGGAAVLKLTPELEGVKAVVTLGAPFDPDHLTHNFGGALDEIQKTGKAAVNLGGRPVTIGKAFVEDISGASLKPALAASKAAILVMHAPLDSIVGIENATNIFVAVNHPKSFVTLDDADHLITDADDASYAADVIVSWSARYLKLPKAAPPIGTPEGIVRVREADARGFLQDVYSGSNHHTVADEPLAYGGTNRGMTPYGYMTTALGACTSMTIRMYARYKGWPLDGISVDVNHDKMHAQDSGTLDKVDGFKRVITLKGKLDESQRKRVLEIADKCPVHKTIEHSSTIETVLV